MHQRQFFALQTIKKFSTSNYIIKPKVKPIVIPKIGIPQFLWSRQEKWFDRVAIVPESFDTGHSYTYYDVYKKSLSLSLFIKEKLKLKAQDTVAIVLNNIPEYSIAVLGAINAGLRVTTCNPIATIDEIKRQFHISQPRLVITLDTLIPKVEKTVDNVPIIEISEKETHSQCISFKEVTTKKETDQPNLNISPNDTSLLLQSSGTTGLPKIVEVTHSNVISNICQLKSPEIEPIKHLDNGKQDVVPAFLPLFHTYGIVGIMLHGFAQGAKIVTMSKFSSDSFISMLKRYKPNVLFCTPPQVLLMIKNSSINTEDLLNIDTVISAAAPLSASDVNNFEAKTFGKVNIRQAYGQTELTAVMTFQSKKLHHGTKIGGSGFLLPNTIAQVIDVATQERVGPNQCGELIVKGPQVTKGYFNNSEANKEAFSKEGWLRTGDIGYYDNDEHFFITDRLKELIKVKGLQVAPAELEAVIREHPSVDDVAVIGVPHDITGEVPKAFVVAKKNHKIDEKEIDTFVSKKVSEYKNLTGGVVFVDSIPKTPSGKILRRDLK